MVSISVNWQFVWEDVFTFPHSLYLHFTELLGQGYRSHISGLQMDSMSWPLPMKPISNFQSVSGNSLTKSYNSCTEHFHSEQEDSQWIAYPSSHDSHMLIKYVSTVATYIWLNLPLFGKVFVGDVLSPVVLMTSMVFLLAVGGESDSLVSWWGGLVDLLDTSE